MNKTVVIIEDELLIAKDIKEILEEDGYYGLICIGGVDEAVKLIDELKPILVLIDINLRQEKDGLFIGRYLLKKDTIPYIYITSNSDKLTLDAVKDTRPHGFIVKPFTTIGIQTTVSIVLHNFKHRKVDVVRRDDLEMVHDAPFRIKAVVKFIDDNIFEKVDVNQLAEITRWKTPYFIRVFSEYIGTTPYQYILIRKISRAKAMIVETNLPLTEIAFELGFHGYANFCNAFKKIEGLTPEQYKRKITVQKHFF